MAKKQLEVFSNQLNVPTPTYHMNGQYVANGTNNEFSYYIDKLATHSPTNAGIINTYVNYILGEKLMDANGKNIKHIIGRNDIRAIVRDYKVHGGYSVQIIWNSSEKNRKVVKIKHLPFKNVALEVDETTLATTGIFYSPDWENTGKYVPTRYSLFDGVYKDEPVEVFIHQRYTSELFYSNPDWLSGTPQAQAEISMGEFMTNHIENGFQGTTLINVPAVFETDEHMEEASTEITRKLTGVGNANKFIVNFMGSADANPMSIEKIEPTEINEQMVYFEESAAKKLLVAHNAPAILFSGTREGGGFNSNADEIENATVSLYRSQILPMREDILEGLDSIFFTIDPTITLEFKDFDKEATEEIKTEE